MTIPATITAGFSSLQTQVVAASPLINASHATVVALQLNAGTLVANIQTALTATVLSVTAAGAFTTASTSIPITTIPAGAVGGMTVYDAASGALVGTVSALTSSSIILTAPSLANSVGTADGLTLVTSPLDTWVAPVDPGSIVTGYLNVVATANDQNTLSLMRGIAGRVASNLDQL